MKSCTVLVVLALICGSDAASSSRASLFPLLDDRRSPEDYKLICGESFGNKCADCYTMLVCLGPDQDPVVTQCSYDKPYCDPIDHLCVSEKPNDPGCDAPIPATFKCPSTEGFFPHPTDCSQYFECLRGKAYNLHCPPKYSWTTDGMGCRQNKKSADCGTIKCKSSDYSVALSNNATFYGMCGILGNIDNILVLKCDGRNMVYVADQGCTFVCPDEGLFSDHHDPTYYHECYKSSSKLLFERKQCTAGRVFDEKARRCVETNA